MPDFSMPESDAPPEAPIDIEDHRGRLADWIAQEQVLLRYSLLLIHYVSCHMCEAWPCVQGYCFAIVACCGVAAPFGFPGFPGAMGNKTTGQQPSGSTGQMTEAQ